MNILTGQIIKLIRKSLKKFSKQINSNPEETYFYIYWSQDSSALKLQSGNKFIKDLKFGDICNEFEKKVYLSLGFDIDNEIGPWIDKFMVACAKENNIEIKQTSYILLDKNGLKAFMFVDNKQYKNISIDYITSFF